MRFCLFCFYLIILQCSVAQNWHQISDFPGTQRDDGTVFVIGDTAYCGTGYLPWFAGSSDFYGFDMSTDSWFAISSLPSGQERQYACGFSDGFSGYIFGGYNSGTFLNDLWQYDPISDQWTEKTSMPAVARSASAHFVIGDTAYIICGKTADNYAINEVWAYSMSSDVWIQKNNFPFGNRWRASGASSQSKGYLLFGKNEILNYDEILYEYNPQIDSWSVIDTFPEAGRTHSSLLFFEDDLLVITGQDSNGNSYNDLWRYNLTAGSWDELNSIPADGRRGGISFHSSSAIYYSTGINQSNIRIKETWKNENPLTADPIEINSHLTLNPNPADNFFSIFGPQQSVNYKVQVYSISGELLMERNAGSENSFDCSNLPNGFYTIFISTPGSVNCSKLIICH